jgi:tRNA (adenine22-N1)-methyltransferase
LHVIKLSPRLAAAAEWVLAGRPLADIGTDHAYLPAYLVGQSVIPRAVAADIQPGPLEAARTTVEEAGLTGLIDLRLGDGLRPIKPGEVATATICGMGGPLIANILAAGPLDGIERLVLQPMGGEEHVRRWLSENGWRLIGEQLVEDGGRLYVILAAERGEAPLTERDIIIGPYLRATGGPLLRRYAEGQLEQLRRARAGAARSSRPEAAARVEELEARIRIWEEVIRHVGDGR